MQLAEFRVLIPSNEHLKQYHCNPFTILNVELSAVYIRDWKPFCNHEPQLMTQPPTHPAAPHPPVITKYWGGKTEKVRLGSKTLEMPSPDIVAWICYWFPEMLQVGSSLFPGWIWTTGRRLLTPALHGKMNSVSQVSTIEEAVRRCNQQQKGIYQRASVYYIDVKYPNTIRRSSLPHPSPTHFSGGGHMKKLGRKEKSKEKTYSTVEDQQWKQMTNKGEEEDKGKDKLPTKPGKERM